jgi:hypothetical protein
MITSDEEESGPKHSTDHSNPMTPENEDEAESATKGFAWSGLISPANSVTDATYSTTTFSGFDTFPTYVYKSVPKHSDSHEKGVCQESYDQGYEDGLKAAKEGTDDRIK